MNLNSSLYSQWNLESTAKLICSKFPDAAVFVIKPSKMLLNTFSVYKNFLFFDEDGVPEFTEDFGALLHIHSLYKAAKRRTLETEQVNGSHGKDGCIATGSGDKRFQEQLLHTSNIPLVLIGFSKGCVVLNQLVHELEYYRNDSSLSSFISNISEIYWLDGGHLGGLGAYITDDKKLKCLIDLRCKIVVHVTPYQICDPRRKWIGEEEEVFVGKLQEQKAKLVEHRHFMAEPGSIENHFKVLTLI